MNRTIKFRGKRTDGKGWVYGDLFRESINHMDQPCIIVLNPEGVPPENFMIAVAPETVGQFTGLLDKHGVEVYEGDLVHDSPVGSLEDSYPVLYSPANAAFAIKKKDWVNSCCLIINLPEFYVTGNIHEKNN